MQAKLDLKIDDVTLSYALHNSYFSWQLKWVHGSIIEGCPQFIVIDTTVPAA
jgi:hypothetical protein